MPCLLFGSPLRPTRFGTFILQTLFRVGWMGCVATFHLEQVVDESRRSWQYFLTWAKRLGWNGFRGQGHQRLAVRDRQKLYESDYASLVIGPVGAQ